MPRAGCSPRSANPNAGRKTTAALARFTGALKDVESQSGLLEENTRLEAVNKELLKKNAELALEADASKRERERLQATVGRMRRAEQAKK